MKIITPSVLALASKPFATKAWNMGRPYFTRQIYYLPSADAIMQRQRALNNQFLRGTQFASPRYELVDNDEKFQLSVDVPGVKIDDIHVSLEDGYLTVTGQRMSTGDNSRYSSKFSQTFSLDAAVDVDKFTASLSDGVLVVEAPKDVKRIEENVVKIPVVEGRRENIGGTVVEGETASLSNHGNDDDDDAAESFDLDQAENSKASADKYTEAVAA